jgi:acyl carrier protein
MADVAERVKKVVSEVLNVDVATLTNETSFVGDLGAESLDSIKLVAGFEEEFDIEMDEDAALEVQSIGAAVEFISKQL